MSPDDDRPPIDLTRAPTGEAIQVSPIHFYSAAWAGIVWPITRGILVLVAAVFLVPFLFVFLEETKMDAAFDWAKTVLAPAVGFASAAIGYYYGTRQESGPAPLEEPVPEE
jgi:hypothetical protein